MSTVHRARLVVPSAACLMLCVLAAVADEPDLEPLAVSEISARNAAAVAVIRVRAPAEREMRYGSGFVVDPSGTIVTALHLLDGADRVLVKTADGGRFRQVGIRAYDVRSDLVVLQVAGESLTAVTVGEASGLVSGDPILVISNPLGLSRTVTEGIVSAWRDPMPPPDQVADEEMKEDEEFGLRRRARAVPDVRTLQISAPISLGSSGAPVFDRSGAVVGMAVAVAAQGALDLNLAIPAEQITPLVERDLGLTLTSLGRQVDRDREELARPHVEQARLALELDDPAAAQRELDAALQLFPDWIDGLLVEAELLRRDGDLEAAERILEQAVRQDPDSVEAWYRLGEIRLQLVGGTGHSLDGAREAFERVLQLDETHPGAAHGLGVIAIREGRLRSATRHLEAAAAAEPSRVDTALWRGEVYLRTGRGYDAEEAFASSLSLGADPALAHHGLARACSSVGKDELSRQHYREFLELTDKAAEHEALRERTILFLRRQPHLMPLEYMDLLNPRSDSG